MNITSAPTDSLPIDSLPTRRPRSARRWGARLAAAGGLAAAVVLGAPLAANAHVGVSPDSVSAGSSAVLTFAFSHGCGESPTTALVFDIPEGVQSVTPTLTPGWTIATEQAANGTVSQVTYTADEPVANGIRATVDLSVRFTAETADTTVAFPVTQECLEGSHAWTEIAADGQDPHDLEQPAPLVHVGPADGDTGHDHGDASDADEHADHDADTDGEAGVGDDGDGVDAIASSDTALPITLGAIGMGLGVVALIVSLVALRRVRA